MDGQIPPPEWHLAHYAKVQRLIERIYGPLLECTHSHPIRIENGRFQVSRQSDDWTSWEKIDPHIWQSTWGEVPHTRIRIYNVCHEVDVTFDIWLDDKAERVLRDNLPPEMRRNRALLVAA